MRRPRYNLLKNLECIINGSNRKYLFFTVFVAGMSTLAIEFTTSRMLQTVYGTSNIVWANVIGLVLLFLTVGYFVGGRWADKRPYPHIFYQLVSWAGFSGVFFLLLTSAILRTAVTALSTLNVNAIVSSLVGVIIALAVPITLLGCISPFAIRLAVQDVGEAGRISGRIYAISTWGSLLGTYLPVLLVIPLAGSRITAVIFGGLLFIVGLIGFFRTTSKNPLPYSIISSILLLLAIYLWTGGNIKQYDGQLFETESAYNYIQVVRQGDCNYLLLNEGQAYHSYYCDNGRVPRISVWSIMLAAPHFNVEPAIKNMAVIGLAAGTIPKQFTQVYGQIPIDGIELDVEIIQAGVDYFALTDPNINLIAGDGRYQLNQLDGRYDIITIDAYKVPYIPWHLTTREFFQEVRAHLTEKGVVAMNIGRAPEDRRLIDAMVSTLLEVYPSVHAIDVPGSFNTIVVATMLPTTADNLERNLAQLENTHPVLVGAMETAVANLVPINPSDVIFTDERAPVETIIDSLVLRYLLSEGVSGLPGLN